MKTTREFLNVLLERVPELHPIYEEHIADYDEVLPHVLMGDVTRFVIDLHKKSWARGRAEQEKKTLSSILEILEGALKSGNDQLQELVVVSFLENLEQDDSDYESLKKLLGKELSKHLAKIEGQG